VIKINKQRAQNVIDFIETLRIPEGMYAGEPFRLRDFQKKIIFKVYSEVDERGLLVTRKAILSVGKKNGKTPLAATLGLVHLCGPEAKRNQQLYSAAFEREQASITFRYMRQMIEMDDELSERLNIKTSVKEIEDPISGSLFKALSREIRAKHGLGPAFLIFDELAQFGSNREFYDTLIQGRGAHEEPLLWIISTQASDDQAVLSEEIDYALKVQKGEIKDPTVKLFLYITPEDADLSDKEAWVLSNPALGDFLNIADMEEASRTALFMPSAESSFRNLRLNQRVASTEHFLTSMAWKTCGDMPNKESLKNGCIYAGLDLSGKNDLTSLILNAVYGNYHNIFSYFWTPGDNIHERAKKDNNPYVVWRDQGYLIATPGKTINYKFVAQQVYEIHVDYGICELRFDRWRIEDFQRELLDLGCDCHIKDKEEPESDDSLCLVPHGQGYKDMNPAIEMLEDLIIEGRINHGNHPVLTMCASNAVIQKDPAGGRKFAKDKSTGRIDGIVAMSMACNGAETPELAEEESVYETRGIRTL